MRTYNVGVRFEVVLTVDADNEDEARAKAVAGDVSGATVEELLHEVADVGDVTFVEESA